MAACCTFNSLIRGRIWPQSAPHPPLHDLGSPAASQDATQRLRVRLDPWVPRADRRQGALSVGSTYHVHDSFYAGELQWLSRAGCDLSKYRIA